jgi:hypothetical protein
VAFAVGIAGRSMRAIHFGFAANFMSSTRIENRMAAITAI